MPFPDGSTTIRSADENAPAAGHRVLTSWNGWVKDAAPSFPHDTAAEPFELVTFYADDELPSVDEVWTARLSYTVVAALGVYIAAVVIAAWLDGRL